jgi:hypothetical protein
MRVRNGLQVCDEWVYSVHDEHNEMGPGGYCRFFLGLCLFPEMFFLSLLVI